MRQSEILPVPCVIPVVGEVIRHWFARDEQTIRAVDVRFSAWPIVDKYIDLGEWQPGFAVTEQAKLVMAFRATRNELLSEDEVKWGRLVSGSGIMRIRRDPDGAYDP